jgi:hypothetical protein
MVTFKIQKEIKMDEPVTCPVCGGLNDPDATCMGALGDIEYFRCVHCGIDFSHHVERETETFKTLDK